MTAHQQGECAWHQTLPFELGDVVVHDVAGTVGIISFIDWDDPIVTYRVRWYQDALRTFDSHGTWTSNNSLRMAEAEIPL